VKGTNARGINPQGDIVGYYRDLYGIPHGFLLHGGTYSTIDDPNGVKGTYARGINACGNIVGFYDDSSFTTHGFLLSGTCQGGT
jgi:probable HAF family extracellular repeat protein